MTTQTSWQEIALLTAGADEGAAARASTTVCRVDALSNNSPRPAWIGHAVVAAGNKLEA